MSEATSQGPRSMPLRTSARGAGTRQAPDRQASHISSHDASKATDSPARTRSSVPSGASCRNSRASASTKAAADRCVTATPLGVPSSRGEDDPRVVVRRRPTGRAPDASGRRRTAQHGRHRRLAEDEVRALLRVVRVHRHVAGADRQHAQHRRVQRDGPGGQADPDPVTGRDAALHELLADPLDLLRQLRVGERAGPVVERQRRGVEPGRLLQDVDQRPGRGRGVRAPQDGLTLQHGTIQHGPGERPRRGRPDRTVRRAFACASGGSTCGVGEGTG
jgi:hypothetical protein